MDVTRESISRILELREILLSFQTDFRLVKAAVVCAILESILECTSAKSDRTRYLFNHPKLDEHQGSSYVTLTI